MELIVALGRIYLGLGSIWFGIGGGGVGANPAAWFIGLVASIAVLEQLPQIINSVASQITMPNIAATAASNPLLCGGLLVAGCCCAFGIANTMRGAGMALGAAWNGAATAYHAIFGQPQPQQAVHVARNQPLLANMQQPELPANFWTNNFTDQQRDTYLRGVEAQARER